MARCCRELLESSERGVGFYKLWAHQHLLEPCLRAGEEAQAAPLLAYVRAQPPKVSNDSSALCQIMVQVMAHARAADVAAIEEELDRSWGVVEQVPKVLPFRGPIFASVLQVLTSTLFDAPLSSSQRARLLGRYRALCRWWTVNQHTYHLSRVYKALFDAHLALWEGEAGAAERGLRWAEGQGREAELGPVEVMAALVLARLQPREAQRHRARAERAALARGARVEWFEWWGQRGAR